MVHDRSRGSMVALAALVCLLGAPVAAQQTTTLTLAEALELARRNNPDFQAQQNDAIAADWRVREAYGAFLPTASANVGASYQAEGTQRVGIFTGDELGISGSTDYYSSDYSLGLGYALSGRDLLAPGQQKAARRATEAGIRAAGHNLATEVTRQYVLVLGARDAVQLAEQELARARDNLALAAARVSVGAAIPLDEKQAQVEVGRSRVSLLQATNQAQTELLRLSQVLGTSLPPDVALTTEFTVFDVPWTLAELERSALDAHPTLRAQRAQRESQETAVRMARTAYLPSLSMRAGWSGYTREAGNRENSVIQARNAMKSQRDQCELLNAISAGLSEPLPNTPADCAQFILDPQDEARIRNSGQSFPFDFTGQPFSLSMQISVPIFQGLGRERAIQEARVSADDAAHRLRAEELRIRTEVGTAYLNLVTAGESVALEEVNLELAADQLELARQIYQVGQSAFIELQEAETVMARADRAYLNAVYAFHQNLAALEAAVGRPLIDSQESR
ncbi:MAG: TolC family protein [Gemmatimonadota bacterium]